MVTATNRRGDPLDEYVALFVVLRDVQALQFLVTRDAQTHGDVQDLEQHDVASPAKTQVATVAMICAVRTVPPSSRPSFCPLPRSHTVRVAKMPVRMAPRVPPKPCTPNASSESSYPSLCFMTEQVK